MIVVCAADKCAGALICDILNGTQSPIVDSIIHNKLNHLLKRPIIEQWHRPDDNTEWVKLPKNEKEWLQVSEKYLNMDTKGVAFGQHNPAYLIPNLDKFETVYNITTTSTNSRWLRFLRNYYLKIVGYKNKSMYAWLKEAYAVLSKFDSSWNEYEASNVINVEFEHIVSGKWCEEKNGDMDHMKQWQKKNHFLYKENPELLDLFTKCTRKNIEIIDKDLVEEESFERLNGQIHA
jgi:hypothetical protein